MFNFNEIFFIKIYLFLFIQKIFIFQKLKLISIFYKKIFFQIKIDIDQKKIFRKNTLVSLLNY